MEDAAARARRYEKALEMIWVLTRGMSGGASRAERDIAAVALGLRAPGTHLAAWVIGSASWAHA